MSRYFRLMALAVTEIFFRLPLTVFVTVSTFSASHIRPWISWADTHQYSSQVRVLPYEVFSAQPASKDLFNLGQWATVGDAFLFFMFFGLSSEARQDYEWIFRRIVTSLGIKPPISKRQDFVQYVCLTPCWVVHKR
jgi:pheromone a factor receptor